MMELVRIFLTIETRDHAHIAEIHRALKSAAIAIAPAVEA